MSFRLILITLILAASTPSISSGQMSKLLTEPGIHDFKFVDAEAYPTNLEEIKKEIGYPIEALKARQEGKVMCRILVDKTGKYQEHKLTRRSHPILDKAVETHISNLDFKPAILNGEPTDYWLNVLFEFNLNENPHKGLNKASSRRFFTRTLSSNHKKAEKYLSHAKSSFSAQNYIQARRFAWSSIHLNPLKKKKSSFSKEILMEAYEIYGKSEVKLGNHQSAVRAFTEAIAIGEDISTQLAHTQNPLINLYLYRGQVKLSYRDFESAMNDLHWVLTNSNNPHSQAKALLVKSVIATQLQEYDQALNDAEKALELNPYYFQAAWQKAEILSFIGAKDEACGILHAYPPVYEAEKQHWKKISEESCIHDSARN